MGAADYHITLRHLGVISDVQRPVVEQALADAVFEPTMLVLTGATVLGYMTEQYLVARIADNPVLTANRRRQEEALAAAGIDVAPPSHPDFIPHITLWGSLENIPNALVQHVAAAVPRTEFMVDGFHLLRSTGNNGGGYELIRAYHPS